MRSGIHTHKQQGAILVVSLLLLLVMTILALSASNSTRLQERMAGNSRDLDLAFQGAEAGLRDAERDVQRRIDEAGGRMFNRCEDPATCVVDRPTDARDYHAVGPEWWEENSRVYGVADAHEFPGLVEDPRSLSEYWTRASDSLTDGAKPGQQSGTAYYVNTARSVGGTASAEVIVQSVYAARYVE